MQRNVFRLVLASVTAGVAIAATQSSSFFLGAPAGTPVPFETVALPQTPTPQVALPSPLPTPSTFVGPFSPPLTQLLEGNTVITTDKQMREVWRRLFSEPYDPGLFDFDETFVVFMGGGVITNGTFDISAVEQVDARYAEPGGLGGGTATETFLSVTATTFLSGVQPQEPPPPSLRLSAVKVARELLDDVVFRRNLILGV